MVFAQVLSPVPGSGFSYWGHILRVLGAQCVSIPGVFRSECSDGLMMQNRHWFHLSSVVVRPREWVGITPPSFNWPRYSYCHPYQDSPLHISSSQQVNSSVTIYLPRAASVSLWAALYVVMSVIWYMALRVSFTSRLLSLISVNFILLLFFHVSREAPSAFPWVLLGICWEWFRSLSQDKLVNHYSNNIYQ